MTETDTTERESNGQTAADVKIDDRTRRALTEPLSVVDTDGTPITDSDRAVVRVVSHTGGDYRVDVREGRCTCPDAQYRNARCKHQRRAAIALGRTVIDAAVLAAVNVDPTLAANAPGPRVAATDGGRGVIDAGDDAEILTEFDASDEQSGERPDECSCDELGGGLPCWACWQAGYRETLNTDA